MLLDLAHGLKALAVGDRDRGLDGDERFAAVWGVGLAWLALAQFLAFVLGARPVAFTAVGLGAALGAAFAATETGQKAG